MVYFPDNDSGINGVVNIFVSSMSYEEYQEVSRNMYGRYLSFEDQLIYYLRGTSLYPKYDYKRTQKVVDDILGEFRKNPLSRNRPFLIQEIKNRLFFSTFGETILRFMCARRIRKAEKRLGL